MIFIIAAFTNVVFYIQYSYKCCILYPILLQMLYSISSALTNVVFYIQYSYKCCILYPMLLQMLYSISNALTNVVFYIQCMFQLCQTVMYVQLWIWIWIVNQQNLLMIYMISLEYKRWCKKCTAAFSPLEGGYVLPPILEVLSRGLVSALEL